MTELVKFAEDDDHDDYDGEEEEVVCSAILAYYSKSPWASCHVYRL